MLAEIRQLLSYSFFVKALIVGSLVSLCAALLGIILVLKQHSMIGDGLSHVGFGSLTIAMVLNLSPLLFSIPIMILTAFILLRISENNKIRGDAAIALIATSALAIGIIAASLANGMNVNVNNYMFGSILAMSNADVYISVILATVVLITFICFYHKIFAITFDENFSKAVGIKTNFYNMIIALLTAITVVIGMRIMGTLLISSLIIFPPLTAMRVFNNFKSVVISSGFISVLCFLIGLMASYFYSLPVGACIVVVNLIMFIIFTIIKKVIFK